MYIEMLMAMFQVAWMGCVTTGFEIMIDMLYMCYDTFWMGVLGNMCDAIISIPVIGPMFDTMWGMIA
ncbi:MAG: hypothetical protein SVE93_07755 [Candidatus Thermoplasmatota archaeon]|nr:hypothetical protein [Candidatus Thermoplasmatota archaeon]